MCENPSMFQVEDLPVGTRQFCSEKCFARYTGLPVQNEGYYGLSKSSTGVPQRQNAENNAKNKINPIERAGISGMASGATIEGLSALMGAENEVEMILELGEGRNYKVSYLPEEEMLCPLCTENVKAPYLLACRDYDPAGWDYAEHFFCADCAIYLIYDEDNQPCDETFEAKGRIERGLYCHGCGNGRLKLKLLDIYNDGDAELYCKYCEQDYKNRGMPTIHIGDEKDYLKKEGFESESSKKPSSVEISRSSKAEKKLMAIFYDDEGKKMKTTHFGQRGASDYTKHGDKERMERYLERHGGGFETSTKEDWKDPTTAGALSRWILWNKPSLSSSFADYKGRFGLKGDIHKSDKAAEEAPSVEKSTKYFAHLKSKNPELARKIEFSVKNEDELPEKEIKDSGYDLDKIEEWFDLIGVEDDNLQNYESCSTCEGEGWILTYYTPATRYEPADGDGEDCEECGGTGMIDPADYMDKEGQYYAESFEAESATVYPVLKYRNTPEHRGFALDIGLNKLVLLQYSLLEKHGVGINDVKTVEVLDTNKDDPLRWLRVIGVNTESFESETQTFEAETCPECKTNSDYICDFCAQCKRCCETSYGCYDVAICNDCDGSFIGKDIDGCCGSCDDCCECDSFEAENEVDATKILNQAIKAFISEYGGFHIPTLLGNWEHYKGKTGMTKVRDTHPQYEDYPIEKPEQTVGWQRPARFTDSIEDTMNKELGKYEHYQYKCPHTGSYPQGEVYFKSLIVSADSLRSNRVHYGDYRLRWKEVDSKWKGISQNTVNEIKKWTRKYQQRTGHNVSVLTKPIYQEYENEDDPDIVLVFTLAKNTTKNAETNGDRQLEESIKRTKMSAIRTGLAITTFGIVLWNLWTNKKQEKQISDIMGLV